MITESDLYHEITQAQPRFFGPGNSVPDERRLADAWPLPAERILFSCVEHDHGEPDALISLHVLDQPRQRIKHVGTIGSSHAHTAAIATAMMWLQGLRAEDLSGYDTEMVDWLGEMAHRMTPDQLAAFQEAYFAIPPDEWGTPENPNPGPIQRLGDVLSSMGFSDDYIDWHW